MADIDAAPVELVTSALRRAGGIAEPTGDGALEALLPPDVAAAWGLPEHGLLATDGRAGSAPCGHGSAALRAAIEQLGRVAVAVVKASMRAPRPGPPEEAYAGLNVALRPGAPADGEGWTLTAHLRLDASADDRRLAPLALTVALDEGVAVPSPDWSGVALDPIAARPPRELLARAGVALGRVALARALEALGAFRETVARRRRRDALRVDRYFVELDRDLRARGPAHDARRAALAPERARRLATLRDDATLRARLEPVALLLVRAPAAVAPLEVHRRKGRRTVMVRWHAALRCWLPLACEGCAEPTRSLGACDDAVHILCASCLARRDCPRCARGGPPPATTRLDVAGADDVVQVPGPPAA